jgi:hypothetical protein
VRASIEVPVFRSEALMGMGRKIAEAMRRVAEGGFTLPTPEQLEWMRKANGKGFTALQLAEWGVPWPPRKGWVQELEKKYNEQYSTSARGAKNLTSSRADLTPAAEWPSLIQRKAQRIRAERGAHAERFFLEREADKLLRGKPNSNSQSAGAIIGDRTEGAACKSNPKSRSACDRRPCATCGTRRETVWLTDRKIGGEVLRELSFCGPDCLRDWELANGCLDTPWAPEPNSKRVEPPPRGCAQCGKNSETISITDGANPDGTLRTYAFCGERCRDAWRAENPFGNF